MLVPMSNIAMLEESRIIAEAKTYCLKYKERLTLPRLEVLQIIAESKKPLSAYAILEKLKEICKSPKPPTVYRAICFWQQKGFISRIESLGAYVICQVEHRDKGSQFMICDECGSVTRANLKLLPQALTDNIDENTFLASRWSIEIHGQCSRCKST